MLVQRHMSHKSRKAACIQALAVLVAAVTLAAPAAAQFFDDRYPFQQRRFLDFQPDDRPADFSRAPAAKKTDIQPTTKILVLGDSLADWLAYGLEDALAETPEIGIIRKHRAFSGLIRYETRSDIEWAQVAREAIAAEKPQAIVMLLGVQDRQAIREKAATPAKPGQPQAGAAPNADPQDSEQTPTIAAPELQRGRTAGAHEYRSERWEQLYSKKIDDTIAALKSANVPVLWVSLPSIRGARSTSDAQYLNELYRSAADRAGIIYVDVWDGFVDEQGRFTTRGPDFEGQIRPLRTADGVHFTKFGARKIAHYVERDLRRVLTAPMPVALTSPADPQPLQKPVPGAPAAPAARPLAGPVLFLASPPHEEELLGSATTRPKTDDNAMRVLVKGEALPAAAGRADDFSWPPRAPNLALSEPLPPSGAPIYASRPLPKPAQPQTAATGPGGTRIAGQPVLQGQIQPQRPQGAPPPFWRQQPPPTYDRPRGGFFGLFGGR